MHVAAARNCKVVGIFMMQRSAIKARPWCDSYSCIDAHVAPDGFTDLEKPRAVTVDEVFEEVMEINQR
jgi:ADP-heptose:LPS heptosyltransferase